MRRHTWLVVVCVPLLLSASSGAGENAASEEEAIYQGKTLAEWIGDLNDPKGQTQRAAAQSLAVFGPKKEVVSALATALKSDDAGVVLPAAQTLGKFGLKARETLPELRVAYKRLSAGPPRLAANKKHSDEYRKMFADARRAVAEAWLLIDDHPGPELAPILLESLQTDHADKRRDIVIKLGKLGPEAAKTTVPALIGVLAETEEVVQRPSNGGMPYFNASSSAEQVKAIRLEAVKSLGRIGSAAKPALHALTLAMKLATPDKETRVQQMEVSDKPAGSAGATIRTISFSLITGDNTMLAACAEALGRICPEAKGTGGALRLALRDLDEGVRWAALCALLESGQDTREVVPILLKFVRDKDAACRRVAVAALSNSGSETDQAVPALVAALKDANGKVRETAAESLGKMRPTNKEVVPALAALLSDPEESVVEAAAKALIKFGAPAKTAIPRLLPLLKNGNLEKRGNYCLLLSEFGPLAKEAIPVLEKLARDDAEELVRLAAYTALARIDPAHLKDTVRRLSTALENKKDEVRGAALECLFFLGPDARDALPVLRALRERIEDGNVKKGIGEVVEQIENPKKKSTDR